MCGQADRRPDVINDSSTRFNSVEPLLDIAGFVEKNRPSNGPESWHRTLLPGASSHLQACGHQGLTSGEKKGPTMYQPIRLQSRNSISQSLVGMRMLVSLISSFALACVAAAQMPPPNRKGPPARQFSQPHGHGSRQANDCWSVPLACL